jgi:hypothetical protein
MTLRFERVTDVRLNQLRDVASGLKYCHDGKIFYGNIHWVSRVKMRPSYAHHVLDDLSACRYRTTSSSKT